MSSSITQSTSPFVIEPMAVSPRIQSIVIKSNVITYFKQQISSKWDLQALECKPFLRFAIADLLDQLCQRRLGLALNSILNNREQGAFVLSYDNKDDTAPADTDFYIMLSTAVSHLVGIPNFDSMYGKYYARFTVAHQEDSDSYLRQAYHRLELHNDGTYVSERTDFVLMMKLQEAYMKGGETLLLHIDDWQDLTHFYQHSMAQQPVVWAAPKSKKVHNKVTHPVFFEVDEHEKPHLSYIDQFAEPQNMPQALYLYEMGESLERDPNTLAIELPVGSMVVIHNHRWLHGRDKFEQNPKLKRELLRQRGYFVTK